MPDTRLERLVYRSRAIVPPASELDAILRQSIWNNARARVTGALGHCGDTYVQLLEGPPASLDDLLSRLGADRRHRDLVVLDRESAQARLVPGWSMARADLGDEARSLLAAPHAGGRLAALLADMVHRGRTCVA